MLAEEAFFKSQQMVICAPRDWRWLSSKALVALPKDPGGPFPATTAVDSSRAPMPLSSICMHHMQTMQGRLTGKTQIQVK